MERCKKRARQFADDFPCSGLPHGGAGSSQQQFGLLDMNSDLLLHVTWFLHPPDILALRETCKVLCNAIDGSRTHIILHIAHIQQTLFLDRCERVSSCSPSTNPLAMEQPVSQSAAVDPGPRTGCPARTPPPPAAQPQPIQQAKPYRSCILSAFDKWPRLQKVYVLGDSPESYITRLVQDAVAAGRLDDLRRILLHQTQWRNHLNHTAVAALVACEAALLGAISDSDAVAELEALDLPRAPPPPEGPGGGAAAAAEPAAAAEQGEGGELPPPPPPPPPLANIPDQRVREAAAQSLIHWLAHFASALSYSGSYDEALRVARLLWSPSLADAVRATLAAVQLARERPLDAVRTVLEMHPRHARAMASIVHEAIQQQHLRKQQKQKQQEEEQQGELRHQAQQQSSGLLPSGSPLAEAAGTTAGSIPGQADGSVLATCLTNMLSPEPSRPIDSNCALNNGEHGAAAAENAASGAVPGNADGANGVGTAVLSGAAASAAAAEVMVSASAEVQELHSRLGALLAVDGAAGGGVAGGGLGPHLVGGIYFGWHAVLLGPVSPLVFAFAEAVAACAFGRPEGGLGRLHLHWLRWQLRAERQRNDLLQVLVELQRRVAKLREKKKLKDDAVAAAGGGNDNGNAVSGGGGGGGGGGNGAVGASDDNDDEMDDGEEGGEVDGVGSDSGIDEDGPHGRMRWCFLPTLQQLRFVRRELFLLERRLFAEQEDLASAVNEYVNKHMLPAGRVHRYSACWSPGMDEAAAVVVGQAATDAAAASSSSAQEVRTSALSSSSAPHSQAEVLSRLIRMVKKQAWQVDHGCRRSTHPGAPGPSASMPPPPLSSSSSAAAAAAAAADADADAGTDGDKTRFLSSSSSSSSSRQFDTTVRETLTSVASLLLVGSGYTGAAARLLRASPLTSHQHRTSLLDRMWALMGATSTWVRSLPCHGLIQDAAGQHVPLGCSMEELEASPGSRVYFLESQRIWMVDDDADDLEDMEEEEEEDMEDEMEVVELGEVEGEGDAVAGAAGGEALNAGGQVAEAAGELAIEGGGDAQVQGQGEAGEDGAAAADVMEIMGLADEEDAGGHGGAAAAVGAGAAVDVAVNPNGDEGDGGMGGGQAVPMDADGELPEPALGGGASVAQAQLNQEQQALAEGLELLLEPPIIPPGQGANAAAVPGILPVQQQEQQQEAAGGPAAQEPAQQQEAAAAAAPAAEDGLPPDVEAANLGTDEQEERFVRQLTRAVQFLWAVSSPCCISDVNPSQFPSGDLCVRGPHPCRGFRAQPALIGHAEAVLKAALHAGVGDCAADGDGGDAGGGGSTSTMVNAAASDGVVEPLLPPALYGGGTATPPGSCEVWQASLAALMAACASAADVQRRARDVVMAMPDIRVRLAAAVAVAAELVQQGETSLAAELLLIAYGTPLCSPGGGNTAVPIVGSDAMEVDGGGSGVTATTASPTALPERTAVTTPLLSSLDFSMIVSGHSALLWACAHLDRIVRLATGRARVCAVSSVLNTRITGHGSLPLSTAAAFARAQSQPAFLDACAAFPAEEARLLVPLMRLLQPAFLERCLSAVPSLLNPTDVARQLLLTSLGRPDPAIGREDMALALQQLMYYSKLSVAARVGLRSTTDMSPLERELTGVSLLLTSLIRFIESPVARPLTVGGGGVIMAGGEGVNLLAGWLGQQQPQQQQQQDDDDDDDDDDEEGEEQEQGNVAPAGPGPEAGGADHSNRAPCGRPGGAVQEVDMTEDWEDTSETSDEEDVELQAEGDFDDGGGSNRGNGKGCPGGSDEKDGGDVVMVDQAAADEAGPEGMAAAEAAPQPPTAPAPQMNIDNQTVRRLRLAPVVLRDLVSEAKMLGMMMPQLHAGSTETVTTAVTAVPGCSGSAARTDAARKSRAMDMCTIGVPPLSAPWRRWPPDLIACRRLPRLLADALRPEDARVLGPLLARTTGALLSWDLPYAVVLAVHAAYDLGSETLGESGADVAVSSLERLCQTCSRYRFVRNMMRDHPDPASPSPQEEDVWAGAGVGTATAAVSAGGGRQRRRREMAFSQRTADGDTGSGESRGDGASQQSGWRLPVPRTSWCMAAELLVHCFAPYWRQRLSAAVLGMSAMVVGLPARDRVGPMAQLFLLAAVGAAPTASGHDGHRKPSAPAQRLHQKLQESQQQQRQNLQQQQQQQQHRQATEPGFARDPSAASASGGELPACAPLPPTVTDLPSATASSGPLKGAAAERLQGAVDVGATRVHEADIKDAPPRPSPSVGERDSLLHMLYDVAHPWQHLLYHLAAAVWGDKLQSPPSMSLREPAGRGLPNAAPDTSGSAATGATTPPLQPLPQPPPSTDSTQPSTTPNVTAVAILARNPAASRRPVDAAAEPWGSLDPTRKTALSNADAAVATAEVISTGRFHASLEAVRSSGRSAADRQPLLPLSLQLSEGLEACFADNDPLTRAVMLLTTVILAAMDLPSQRGDRNGKLSLQQQQPAPQPQPAEQPGEQQAAHQPGVAGASVGPAEAAAALEAAVAGSGQHMGGLAWCQRARASICVWERAVPRLQKASLLGLVKVLQVPKVVLTTLLEGLLTLYLPRRAKPPGPASNCSATGSCNAGELLTAPAELSGRGGGHIAIAVIAPEAAAGPSAAAGSGVAATPLSSGGKTNESQLVERGDQGPEGGAGRFQCTSCQIHEEGAEGCSGDGGVASDGRKGGGTGNRGSSSSCGVCGHLSSGLDEDPLGRVMFLLMARLVAELIRDGYTPGPPPHMPRLEAALQRARADAIDLQSHTKLPQPQLYHQQQQQQERGQKWQQDLAMEEDPTLQSGKQGSVTAPATDNGVIGEEASASAGMARGKSKTAAGFYCRAALLGVGGSGVGRSCGSGQCGLCERVAQVEQLLSEMGWSGYCGLGEVSRGGGGDPSGSGQG